MQTSYTMPRTLMLIASIIVLNSCSVDSVNPVEEREAVALPFLGTLGWVQTLGGSGLDTFHAVIPTSDGGFAAFGSSNSTDGDLEGKPLAVSDYWLVKFDSQGEKEWGRTYGGSGEDLGQALVQTSDGGYALSGYAMSSDGDASNNEGFHDNWIIKLDAGGSIEWEQSFGFAGHDHSYDLLQTRDGGYFFVGFLDITASGGAGSDGKYASLTRHGVGEFWGSKIDASGQLQWRRFFGGTNNDRAHAVVEGHSGGFVMAGFSESDDFDISNPKGSYDFWVVKISEGGELLWEHSYGGSGIEISYDIARTGDGGYVVVGNTFSTDTDIGQNQGGSDIWMIKIDDAGNLLWEQTYGGSDFDAAQAVIQSRDGGFIISGNTRSNDGDSTGNHGENDIWIIKTDAGGQLVWQQRYGGTALDFGFSAFETVERDIVVVGETASQAVEGQMLRGQTDAVVLKIVSGLKARTE